jgi:hypothetical protein
MVAGKTGRRARVIARIVTLGAVTLLLATAAAARAGWCLGLGSLGPIQVGMPVEQVLPMADFPGMERRQAPGECWYLRYRAGGADFDLMILGGTVARIELNGASKLRTLSGAAIGDSEARLRELYGAGLDQQPAKYDPQGHTLTWRPAGAGYGLRFETARGRVTAIQSGRWEQLHYVEGCG